jgi:heparanase 1
VQKGITILLINLDNSTTIQAKVGFNSSWSFGHKRNIFQLLQVYEREEYHLTAKDGNLHSQKVLLNGNILTVNSSGEIPPLEPLYANSSNPIKVDPFSVVFVHIPDLLLPACM